jgi:hypothetical protein
MARAEAETPRTIEDAQAVAVAARARMRLMATALRDIQLTATAGGPEALQEILKRSSFALDQQDWISKSST